MEKLDIRAERHPVGGPGRFLLGRAEALCPGLVEEYGEKARLIYLDPPFGTGDTFSMRFGKTRLTVPTYEDGLDPAAYMRMMRTVLTACRALLTPDGSLYLHVDYRKSGHMRLLLDEIFEEKCFVNEIIWSYKSGGRSTRHYARKHDTVFLYGKTPRPYFNMEAAGTARGPERRNHMRRTVDEQGRVCYSIRSGGKTYTYHEDTPVYPTDVWADIEHLHQRDPERTGYNTQKPEALLRRIIDVSSAPGDLVMDLFSGSGTTAAVAASRGRTWVAADASLLALCTLRRRLLTDHRELSFLDASHGMTLEYAQDTAMAPPFAIADTAGEKKAAPHRDAAVGYLALGRVEEGMFLPRAHAFDPKPGEGLRIQAGDTAVQAVDMYGKQGFWRL